ncbi:hypothetical protein [Enterococcus silesiacus]|nr:hypothetical protein [Enterococcus silesiacus]
MMNSTRRLKGALSPYLRITRLALPELMLNSTRRPKGAKFPYLRITKRLT